MRWSADVSRRRTLWAIGRLAPTLAMVAVLSGASSAAGQPVDVAHDDGAWTPEPALEARVREEVARRWGIDADVVHLEWGRVRGPSKVPADAALRFIGTGAGGAWVIAFDRPDGPPLQVRMRAGVAVTRPVAARDLERGDVLGAEEIGSEARIEWGPPAPVSAVEPGWVARRRIAAGQPLVEPAVGPPNVVEAGSPVEVMLRSGSIVLTLRGRALGSAALGETIAFRTESGRRLEGVAAGPSLIQIEAMAGSIPGRNP